MNTGLLWYDGDPARPLETKVRSATLHYYIKYGYWPNTCHVHPNTVGDVGNEGVRVAVRTTDPERSGVVVRVVANPRILRHHFWVGCQEQEP